MNRVKWLGAGLLVVALNAVAGVGELIDRWDDLLADHVSAGSVDYPAIQRDPRFPVLVTDIAAADLDSTDEPTRLAFYVNTYNVLAIDGILQGLSPRTALGKWRYFYRTRFNVAGKTMTLNQLEHDIIRKMNEPRIHFAIVCASISCPILQSSAYQPETLDQQLEHAARQFINDPTRNRFKADQERAEISKIFKWFAEDFVGAAGSVSAYLADFVENPDIARALERERYDVRYLPYDWNLNGPAPDD